MLAQDPSSLPVELSWAGLCWVASETSWEVHPDKKGKTSTANRSDSSALLVISDSVYCEFKTALKQLISSVMEHH